MPGLEGTQGSVPACVYLRKLMESSAYNLTFTACKYYLNQIKVASLKDQCLDKFGFGAKGKPVARGCRPGRLRCPHDAGLHPLYPQESW